MADTPKPRPLWAVTRRQGVGIMLVGIAMLFVPATAPHAGQVIAVGAGWALGGANANEMRKIFMGKANNP